MIVLRKGYILNSVPSSHAPQLPRMPEAITPRPAQVCRWIIYHQIL